MKTKNIMGILILIGLLVVVSGCTSQGNNTKSSTTEKVLMDSNISAGNVKDINLAIPEGASTIRVEYSNLTKSGGYDGLFDFYVLNVIPQEGQPVSNYVENVTDSKTVFVESTSYMDGSLELDAQGAKTLVVVGSYLKGHIRITAS